MVKPLAAVSGPARPPSGGRPRGGTVKPAVGRGLAATLSDGRSEVAVVVRPVVSPMPAGTTLRVELLAERRGSELRTDVTAEAETVHVRVWQDGVEALDRHFRAPRRGDADLLAEAIETGRRDPVVGRCAPGGGRVDRLGGSADRERTRDRRRRQRGRAAARAAADGSPLPSPTRWRRRGRADWVTTGGSALVARYRRLAAEPARRRDPVGRRPRLVGRRSLRAARPPALERQAVRRRPARYRRRGGGHGQWQTSAACPSRFENIHPFPTGEAIGRGAGAAWCAAALADELRAAGLPEQDGWPVFDLIVLGVGADGHLLSVFPGSAAFDSTELALAIPAPTHIEPHVERVTLNPAVVEVARQVLVVAHGDGEGPGHGRDLRPGTRSAPLAGPAGPARGRGLDPRRGGRERAAGPVTTDEGYTEASRFEGLPAVTIRPARESDGPGIGDVWLAAWYATFDFPPSHPDDDVRRGSRPSCWRRARCGWPPSPMAVSSPSWR